MYCLLQASQIKIKQHTGLWNIKQQLSKHPQKQIAPPPLCILGMKKIGANRLRWINSWYCFYQKRPIHHELTWQTLIIQKQNTLKHTGTYYTISSLHNCTQLFAWHEYKLQFKGYSRWYSLIQNRTRLEAAMIGGAAGTCHGLKSGSAVTR